MASNKKIGQTVSDTSSDENHQGIPSVDQPARSESQEREDAWERGQDYRLRRAEGIEPQQMKDDIRRTNPAFAALADNVRDYAVFLMNPNGIIVYWGEGARLVKWWTDEEAEGAHLRLLYPEGGSEDGTAEDHLRESEQTGEYVGEGQRVRADQSTFWARTTLTALRDTNGELIGFCKVTRDLSAQRAQEAIVSLANAAQENRDKALALAKEALDKLDRAQEEIAFAREQARSAQEYIEKMLLTKQK